MRNHRNVLYLLTGAFHSDGGIAALNRLTLYALAQRENSINVLALAESNSAVDIRYFPKGYPIHVSTFNGNKYSFSFAVWKELFFHRYELVLADHVNLAAILAPLNWLGICRYYVWLCGIEVFEPRPDREGKLGLKHAFGRLAISRYTYQHVKDRFPELQVAICDLGLDPILHSSEQVQSPVHETLEMESINGDKFILGERVILHVGRMASQERYKGQETLLRALPIIHEKFPQVQLVLIGQGNDHERLLAIARALPEHLHNSIFMPGFMPAYKLDKIYQSCFVFAMPSIGEGFGLVYLEAMAHAKPCLGGNVDATPYVIRDGITGLLVNDPKNEKQVANYLLKFFNDPRKAQEMGEAGYKLLHSYYLPQHFAERLWRALEIRI